MTFYELNAWAWLSDLEARYGRSMTLSTVPAVDWDWLGGLGVDAVWLMGVWQRSPAGVRIARALPELAAWPDIAGSPYCVREYSADPRLGGTSALLEARFELARRGIRLILDFVPNHAARDHDWVAEHPEYFIAGSADDLRREPQSYFTAGGHIFACGRDPYFPAWTDVAQLNAFSPGWRREAASTLNHLAGLCDGVRCDMAMLLLNDVFSCTWGMRAGPPPATEFWEDVIGSVRARHAGFLFLAEAYWDREWDLQQLGFDYCYDKRLYDRLVHSTADDVRGHLRAEMAYQNRLLRFIENHDEPRAATVFAPAQWQAAATVSLTLPGAALLHEGQMHAARVKLPVQAGRRPPEAPDASLEPHYRRLLRLRRSDAVRRGRWRLADPGEGSLLAWEWQSASQRLRVAVNWSPQPVRQHVPYTESAWVELPAWGVLLDHA